MVLIKTNGLPSPYWRKKIHIWWRGKTNGSLMMILGHLLQDNWEWSDSQIEVLRSVEELSGVDPAMESLQALIRKSRIEATPQVFVNTGPFNETLRTHSGKADCLFLGFNFPEEGKEAEWHRFYQNLLKRMPTTILIHSCIEEDLLE